MSRPGRARDHPVMEIVPNEVKVEGTTDSILCNLFSCPFLFQNHFIFLPPAPC